MDPEAVTDLHDRLERVEAAYQRFADRTLWLLTTLVVLLLIVGAWSVYLTWQGAEAHHAVCAFRGDLKDRVRGSEDFLRKHPQGIQDVSAAEIQVGVNNQRRTVHSLRDLSCG